MQPYLSDYAIVDATSTPIPASSSLPLELVSELSKNVSYVIVRDGIQGKFMELLRGPEGEEVVVALIGGPGESKVPAWLVAGQRVSIRNADNAAINTGSLAISFISEA